MISNTQEKADEIKSSFSNEETGNGAETRNAQLLVYWLLELS